MDKPCAEITVPQTATSIWQYWSLLMIYVYTFQCKSITFVHYHFCLRQRDKTCTLARKEMTKMVMQILEFEELSNIHTTATDDCKTPEE